MSVTASAKKSQTWNEKVPMVLKDFGLLGFCIYVLWADNDKNKAAIQQIQEKQYRFELVQNNLVEEMEDIQEQSEKQTIIIEKILDRVEENK